MCHAIITLCHTSSNFKGYERRLPTSAKPNLDQTCPNRLDLLVCTVLLQTHEHQFKQQEYNLFLYLKHYCVFSQ